jgi:hypothetical protein
MKRMGSSDVIKFFVGQRSDMGRNDNRDCYWSSFAPRRSWGFSKLNFQTGS